MWTNLRGLFRRPGFSILAIVSLSAGLALITALILIADAILFRPLPVARPQEIARIFTATRENPMGFVSFPDYRDLTRVLPQAAAQTQVLIAAGDPPRIRMGLAVTRNYFDVLGVRAASGRMFQSEDDFLPRVVLSYSFWRANPEPTITLGRTVFRVIGVAPENFGLDRFLHEDFYVTTGAYAAGLLPSAGRPLEDRGRRFFQVFARVPGGVDSARAPIAAAGARLEAQFPETNRGRRAVLMTEREARLLSDRTMAAAARIFAATAVLILAITAANFTGLLLVRAQRRARDVKIRSALGAAPLRLFFDRAIESAILCGAAAAIGVPAGSILARILAHAAAPPADFHVSIDPVLAPGTALLATGAALFAALLGVFPLPAGRMLVGVDIALAALLCCADTMLIERIAATRKIDLGYRTHGIFVAALDPAQLGYDEARTRVFYDRLLDQVRGAELAQSVPLGYTRAQREIAIGNEPEKLATWMNIVTPGYFDLMRIRPIAGRIFDRHDRSSVAVVNAELARRCGVGCRLRIDGRTIEVIGVVPTAKYFYPGEPPAPFLYLPFSQNFASRMIVHVEGGPELVDAIHRIEPLLAVSETRMLDDYLSQGATFHMRMAHHAVGTVAFCGLILAVIGVYGIVSQETARRQREIAVRISLGARRETILGMVLRRYAPMIAVATIAGAGAGILTSPLISAGPLQWWPASVFSEAVVMMATLGAAMLPAWRASQIDPAVVLRRG